MSSPPTAAERIGTNRTPVPSPLAILLVAVVFAPVVDRYLVSLVVPTSLRGVTAVLSEALLVVVALVVTARAWRHGTLMPALRHPVVVLLGAFICLGLLSAAVNGVPPAIAVAGILFTVDAAALFVLPRMAGLGVRDARFAFLAFTAMTLLLAVLALGQVLLHANLLGLQSFAGRFSEGHRVSAFLVNPNMLGAVLAMGIPGAAMASLRAGNRRTGVAYAAVTFLLALALLYTFSRGAWLGLAAAILLIGASVDWRAPVVVILCGVLAFGAALVLPRHVLQPDAGDAAFDLGAATFGRLETLGDGTDLRLRFIENGAPIIADHPILGAGPGRYGGAVAWRFGTPLSETYTAGTVPTGRTVDNFWLHLLAEFGVLGAGAFLAALAAAVAGALRVARRGVGWHRVMAASAAAMAVVIGIDSLTEMLLEGNTTAFAVWFFLGLATLLASATRAPVVGAAGEG